MSKEDEKKNITQKVAENKNVSFEEAQKIVDSVFKDQPDKKIEDIKKELGVTKDFMKAYSQSTKDMDPVMKYSFGILGSQALQKIAQPAKTDSFEDDLDKLMKRMERMEMINMVADRFYNHRKPQPQGVTEEGLVKAMKEEIKTIIPQKSKIEQLIEKKIEREFEANIDKKEEPKVDPSKQPTPFEQIKVMQDWFKAARTVFEESGYKIEHSTFTRDQLPEELKKMNPEDLANILEARGFQISGRPVPFQKHQEDLVKAKEDAKNEAMEDKNATIIANLVEKITDNFFGKVLGPAMAKGWNQPTYEQPPEEPIQTEPVQTEPVQEPQQAGSGEPSAKESSAPQEK